MHRDAELNELTGFGLGATLFLVQTGLLGLRRDRRGRELLGTHRGRDRHWAKRASQSKSGQDGKDESLFIGHGPLSNCRAVNLA
jgi:hypothetical protein